MHPLVCTIGHGVLTATAGRFAAHAVFCMVRRIAKPPAHEVHSVAQVLRKGEAQRFQQHTELGNRRLLWHGTNVAVVATVLKTGLRIMPHSGGRVGEPFKDVLLHYSCAQFY